MLKNVDRLTDFSLEANDGEIGHCSDFLFDDRDWTVRYMVARTGGWLTGRKVLISPASLRSPRWDDKLFPVDLTREQIENSPPLDEHAPVSREYERAYHTYLEMPFYWVGTDLWGSYPDPTGMLTPVDNPGIDVPPDEVHPEEPHLRSCAEILGYRLACIDDDTEAISDLLVDDHTWQLRYLVADINGWLPGGKVLVPTGRLTEVNWEERRVGCDLTRERLENSPTYRSSKLSDRDFESEVEAHYAEGP